MTSSKPYLFHAILNWIVDNNMTPYIAANIFHPDTQVPEGYDKDGIIVLDISAGATRNLEIDMEGIFFNAKFKGVSHSVFVPMGSIVGIYARENGQGMMFEPEDFPEPKKPEQSKRPVLSVVK